MVLVVLILLGFLRIWPDPFYHKERVSFYLWAAREVEELYTGERE